MNESLDDFKLLLATISQSLQNAEQMVRKLGYNSPIDHPEITNSYKIQLPKGYIRTIEYFIENYKLRLLFENKILIKNVAYSLQTSDLYNYFINRFSIGLSVGQIFFKLALINTVSISEAILYGIIEKQNRYCKEFKCKNSNKCQYYIQSPKSLNFGQMIEITHSKIFLSCDEIKDVMSELKKYRNNIHLSLVKENECSSNRYNIKLYNKSIKLLHFIKKNSSNYIEQFQLKRTEKCKCINF